MDYQEYMKSILNDEEIKKLMLCYQKESVHALRVNLLKADSMLINALLPLENQHPFVKEAYIFDNNKIRPGKDPLHYAGAYYLQEPSAMMVAYLLGIKSGDKVLDLCAAPGGKSSQVLSYLNGSGVLVANDVSYKRAQVLSENIERMGASNAYVLNEEVANIEKHFYGFFDKVVLDAPCSGQGMFRKNELVYQDWTYNKTLSLAKTNKELIISAYNCLKRDGILIYSTCTFTKEEDEEVIEYLLENTNASIIKIPSHELFSKAFIDGAIRLYPFVFNGEGHFICMIKCNDDHQMISQKENKGASNSQIKLYKEFEQKYLNINLEGKFIMMGSELHFLQEDYFCLDKLKVLRNGLHLGTIKDTRFEPSHALALFLKPNQVKLKLNLDHLDKESNDYLKGMTLNSQGNKGYVLVCINGISVGWGKDDGRIIKNLYPKGLRML